MENFLQKVKAQARKSPKRIVFPEGHDDRILRSSVVVKEEGLAIPVLVGDPASLKQRAKELNMDLEDNRVEIVDINNPELIERYAEELLKIREKKGWDKAQCKEVLKKHEYFGTMMVQLEEVDAMISGAVASTADTVRPALQIIKTKEKFHKVSGFFFMLLGLNTPDDPSDDRMLLFADCAILVEPDAKDLADIALDTALTAKRFGMEPKVAMLSFSTNGSADHPNVKKVRDAIEIFKQKNSDIVIEGEMQVDAALVPDVCAKKFPNSKIQGDANVLIFPDLESANIAYKLVERLAKAKAIGPILQGLNKPVNDLSRGCSIDDIVNLAAITSVEARDENYEV